MNRCTTRFAFGAKCGTFGAIGCSAFVKPAKAIMPKPVPVRVKNSRRENTHRSATLIDEGEFIS